MKISVEDKELFTLSETQKKVIKDNINEDIFDEYARQKLQYILMHKYERCFERLKKEWEPKLAKRMGSIPTNPDAFANIVFSQPDYKNRKMRESIPEL